MLLLHSLQSQSKELKHLCHFYSNEFLSFFVQHFCIFSILLVTKDLLYVHIMQTVSQFQQHLL